jgi:hypothetical protein
VWSGQLAALLVSVLATLQQYRRVEQGGTVLRTNVDVERARLIQSTLAAALPDEMQRLLP